MKCVANVIQEMSDQPAQPIETTMDVKCVENVIQEMSDQPAQPIETTMDDLTKNNDAVTAPLSESG